MANPLINSGDAVLVVYEGCGALERETERFEKNTIL